MWCLTVTVLDLTMYEKNNQSFSFSLFPHMLQKYNTYGDMVRIPEYKRDSTDPLRPDTSLWVRNWYWINVKLSCFRRIIFH